jgi:hypothetical protein
MVVTTDCHEKKDHLNIVENVDPLLPLGPLPTHIEHAVCEASQLKYGFCDTGGP